jgi:hypothetical protein
MIDEEATLSKEANKALLYQQQQGSGCPRPQKIQKSVAFCEGIRTPAQVVCTYQQQSQLYATSSCS